MGLTFFTLIETAVMSHLEEVKSLLQIMKYCELSLISSEFQTDVAVTAAGDRVTVYHSGV
jgi:hypothetical protein